MCIRRFSIALTVLVSLVVFSCVFAQDNVSVNIPPYEILSPKINSKGDVIREQHLLLSLRVNQSIDAVMTLTRIDEPKVAVASLDSIRRLKAIASQALVNNNTESITGQDPMSVVHKHDLLGEDATRAEIQEALFKASFSLTEAHENYLSAYSQARRLHENEKLQNLVNQRRLLQANLRSLFQARQVYERASIIYMNASQRYENLFRVVIVDRVSIELQGALPIFNITVRDIVQIGRAHV